MMLKTRDDYQFVLVPWEHRGAHFDARPDLVATAQVGGATREFLLKAKRNILFFREVDKGDEFLCALSAPLTQSVLPEAELREWMQQNAEFVRDLWRGEVEQETYARCFVDDDFHVSLSGAGIVFFQRDGRGWLREPWDESGLSFEWKPDASESRPLLEWEPMLFPSAWNIRVANRELGESFEYREMPKETIAPRRLEWLCGSRDELERVTRWIVYTEPDSQTTEFPLLCLFDCENEHHPAHLSVCGGIRKPSPISPRMRALTNLALDFNTPTGLTWEFCDGSSGSPPIRRSWDPYGPDLEIQIEVPSFHEQLEARLELREWLRGKVSAEQIENWLQT